MSRRAKRFRRRDRWKVVLVQPVANSSACTVLHCSGKAKNKSQIVALDNSYHSGDGYNYDSTCTRFLFDFDSTAVRRPFDCLWKVIKVTVT